VKTVKGDKGSKGDHGEKGNVGNLGPGGNPVSIIYYVYFFSPQQYTRYTNKNCTSFVFFYLLNHHKRGNISPLNINLRRENCSSVSISKCIIL